MFPGKLRFNGVKLDPKMVPRVVTLVPQQDIHTPVPRLFSFDLILFKSDLIQITVFRHGTGGVAI